MTVLKLIEKYKSLRDEEEVAVVKAMYANVVNDLSMAASAAEKERRRAEFQKVLDALERLEDMDDPSSQCKRCGMPCEKGALAARSALPAAGGGVICEECL